MSQSAGTDLDRALAASGDGAFMIGPDGRIVLWNRAAEKMLGHSARQVLGRPCREVFAGVDDNGNRLCYQGCHVATLVRMGEPVQSFDLQTRTRAGRPIWLNMSTLTVTGNGRGPFTVHLFRDVTTLKGTLAMVRELSGVPAPPEEAATLTRRELEVLRLLAAGVSTRAAAERLHVSRATVRNHVQNLLGKLGVHSRLEAVAYATTHRLVS